MSSEHSWWVYIVRCSDGTLYTGTAAELEKRIAVHNSGKGAKYTRSRLPVTLVYWEECATKGDALRREYRIKRLTRTQKLLLVKEQEEKLKF